MQNGQLKKSLDFQLDSFFAHINVLIFIHSVMTEQLQFAVDA